MKRLVLWVFFVLFGVGNLFAVDMVFPAEKCVLYEQDIELELDVGQLDDVSLFELENEIDAFLSASLPASVSELNCSVSVKGKVNIGVASVEITVEVSGPCSEVRASGSAIAHQVLQEIKDALR